MKNVLVTLALFAFGTLVSAATVAAAESSQEISVRFLSDVKDQTGKIIIPSESLLRGKTGNLDNKSGRMEVKFNR